jgi:aerobic-type carbon monoxide dehydrogenase small subunit (CoxS/CutS family)
MNVNLTVNGRAAAMETDLDRPLLDVLREDLHLTGAKYGCGNSNCGACTVLLDGKRVYSCQTPIEEAAGKQVLTIEGLAHGDTLHPVQQAFVNEGAFQCGYCTPGMIMSATALLKDKPAPTDEQVVSWMNRNICRCCSYARIHSAVLRAAELAGR